MVSAVGHAEYQPSRYIIIFNCIDNLILLIHPFTHSPIQSITVHVHSFTLSVYSIGQDGHMHCHPCSPSNGPTTATWTQKSKQQTEACPRFNSNSSNNNNIIVLVTVFLHPFRPFPNSCTIDIDKEQSQYLTSRDAVLLVPFEGSLRCTFIPQSDFVAQNDTNPHLAIFCCCLSMNNGWFDRSMGTRIKIKRSANLTTTTKEIEESHPQHVFVVSTEVKTWDGSVCQWERGWLWWK